MVREMSGDEFLFSDTGEKKDVIMYDGTPQTKIILKTGRNS